MFECTLLCLVMLCVLAGIGLYCIRSWLSERSSSLGIYLLLGMGDVQQCFPKDLQSEGD